MIQRIALMLASLAGAPAAVADSYYNHNGSIMRLVEQGNTVRILYHQPREGLASVGAHPGTVLFEGQLDAGLYLDGMTRLFSARCGEQEYYVYGQYWRDGDFTLAGAAPVLESGGCRVLDNTYDGPDANLFFAWLRTDVTNGVTPDPASGAESAGGSGPFCVTGISSILNLRTGPGVEYAVIGGLPANACGVAEHGRCESGWCFVSQGPQIGWAVNQYLRRQ